MVAVSAQARRGIVLLLCMLIVAIFNFTIYGVPNVNSFRSSGNPERGAQAQRLPKALIIGAPKCGTDALNAVLRLHPQIVSPMGEVRFFSTYYEEGHNWYKSQMPFSYEDQITIEKAADYIFDSKIAERIKHTDSNMKLILIVREPVTRLISHYTHFLALYRARRKITIEEAMKHTTFEQYICYTCKNFSQTVQLSKYSIYLSKYLKVFPKSQILVLDGDEFAENPFPAAEKGEKFLNLPHMITSENLYYNSTKGFFCMNDGTESSCMNPGKGRKHPYVDPEIIKSLRIHYHPYNLDFYNITGTYFQWPKE